MTENMTFLTGMAGTIMALGAAFAWSTHCTRRKEPHHGMLEDLATHRGAVEIGLFLLAYTVFYLFSNHKVTFYNNYSYLAQAFLNGRLDVPDLPSWLESVQFRGMTYVHFAPGPALLCLPFVAVLGVDGFNSAWLCLALGAANAVLVYRILCNLKLGTLRDRLWMTALMIFGTVHFWCASWGSSWLLGHLSTLFFWGLAMVFLTGERPHDFLSGLFFGLSVTCRMTALLGGIFFAGWLLLHREKKWRACLVFAGGAAIFGGLYMLYNYVRFGTIMDKSYTLTYLKDKHREVYDALQAAPVEEHIALLKEYEAEYGGPLQWKNVAYNLKSMLTELPEVSGEFPWLIPTQVGVAITLCSPALLFALGSSPKKPETWLLWVTALATAMPFLLNYGNGMSQFGMRYSLDFTPYLFLLSCRGMGKLNGWKKGAICWCILVNAWGALYWKCFY